MSLPQCEAIVTSGRSASGRRAGLVPPRRCGKVATAGDYCGNHSKQADLQTLYRSIFGSYWEQRVQTWQREQNRKATREGADLVRALSLEAWRNDMGQLSSFLDANRSELAEAWSAGPP